jgi:hypothetical protein
MAPGVTWPEIGGPREGCGVYFSLVVFNKSSKTSAKEDKVQKRARKKMGSFTPLQQTFFMIPIQSLPPPPIIRVWCDYHVLFKLFY